MIKTVKVTGYVYNQNGDPATQARGRATLSHYDIDNGVVVPWTNETLADDDGYFEIDLWPNERGSSSTYYELKFYSKNALVLDAQIVVPDVDHDVSVYDIINQEPYPPIDSAQQALIGAQKAATEAKASANSAATSADNALTSENNAANSATTASAAADAAVIAATSASNSASAASTSESNAATSASDAGGYAASAESSATSAASSASDAATSATTATNAATAAGESAILAEQSAINAVTIVSSVKQSSSRIVPMLTPNGQVTHMYRIPAFNLEGIDPSGQLGEGLHPAFIFNGVPEREIFVGAYPAAEVNGEIVCQPGLDPRASINFDNARAACQALGPGWDMMSNWDWAAIALWCAANGFSPRGNTNYGRSNSHRFETATRVVDLAPGVAESSLGRTLTGSGPATWTHDGTGNGIHDLVGNVWEWVTGLLLEENIFKIAPDNGVYAESEYIDTLVEAAGNGTFSTRAYDDPPLILKQAMAVPTAGLTHDGRFYKNAEGQRFPYRGGTWNTAGSAGLDALYLSSPRAYALTTIGFRPRFRNQ